MCLLGVLSFAVSLTFIVSFSIFSVNISNKIKVNYFRECLRKDAAWYDMNNSNEMSAKIAKETGSIQRGSGDKIGLIFSGYFGFLMAFALSFYFGWLYTCILLVSIPVLGATGALFAGLVTSTLNEQMKSYTQSAGYAEQALSSIKVVQTYGNEMMEVRNYNKYLLTSIRIGKKMVCKKAIGNSFMFLTIFLFYGYAFYWGGFLRENEIKNGEEVYEGGAIMAVMFMIIFGGM